MNFRFAFLLGALLICIAPANASTPVSSRTSASSASHSLQGPAAIENLRQSGHYDSLAAAFNATRYGMQRVANEDDARSKASVADNPS
jgi:hypothetical protein